MTEAVSLKAKSARKPQNLRLNQEAQSTLFFELGPRFAENIKATKYIIYWNIAYNIICRINVTNSNIQDTTMIILIPITQLYIIKLLIQQPHGRQFQILVVN